MKRFLDCNQSDFEKMDGMALKSSIAASEGRIIACETIGTIRPMLGDITNAEFVASMGADIVLLNLFDVIDPVIVGLPKAAKENTVKELKRLIGRPVGINLEPVEQDSGTEMEAGGWAMTEGRKATVSNAEKAADMGVDLIVLTGNPGIGVSNKAITESLKAIKKVLENRVVLVAGKMHASGIMSEAAENIITPKDIQSFVEAGADVILMPAPGTVPGITMEYIKELVSFSHSLGVLTMTAIGTSQEGADADTIKSIALMCKMTGTDIHHLGDTGYFGMAVPENIMDYGKVIRGVRHTYHRIAASIRR